MRGTLITLSKPLRSAPVLLTNFIRTMSTQPQVHQTSLNSFDSNHTLYDKVRPGFSHDFVKSFFQDLSLTKPYDGQDGQKLLELAIGTGKFTNEIVKLGWSDPENFIAVEPSTGMLDSFRKNFPEINSLQGSSYELPVEDNTYDAVIIAQGFHWFADHNSLKEIYRVLKPGGKLGLIWNFDVIDKGVQLNLEDAQKELGLSHEEIKAASGWCTIGVHAHEYDGDVPQYRKAVWREAFKNQEWFKNDSTVNSYQYQFSPFPTDLIYDYWLSRSYITSLPEEDKAAFKKRIEEDVLALEPEQKYDENNVKQFLGTHYFVIESAK